MDIEAPIPIAKIFDSSPKDGPLKDYPLSKRCSTHDVAEMLI
jgi:hypothetical protein